MAESQTELRADASTRLLVLITYHAAVTPAEPADGNAAR